MLPWAKARLQTSRTVATPLRCWVRPIAQQNTVAVDLRSSCASSVICPRDRPVTSVTIAQSTALTCAFHSSNPVV